MKIFARKRPTYVIIFVLIIVLGYNFSYLYPFTNNAFVTANVRPVAADVEGYITKIYVKNEDYVVKGQPLFSVFKKPYELTYKKFKSEHAADKARLRVLNEELEKTKYLILSQEAIYQKLNFDSRQYDLALRDHAVSKIDTNTLLNEKKAAFNKLNALKKELSSYYHKIDEQKMRIKASNYLMKNALVNLNETTVYAKNNGIIQNMYSSLGTPIKLLQPVFSFIDTDSMYLQANLNETDLRKVKAGDKVTIYTRMYFTKKIYHGEVVSRNWAASRQVTDFRSQEQIVTNNENNWFLLPQRFPVQIKLIDYDPKNYPLGVGASAYIIIHV